jgi:hypothetical protein
MASLTGVVACGKFQAGTAKPGTAVAWAAYPEVVDLKEPVAEKTVVNENTAAKPLGPKGAPQKVASSAIADADGPGVLKPTIYYFASITEDEKSCAESAKKTLHGAGGVSLLKVCPQTEAICGEQGSCRVIQYDKVTTLNVIGRFNNQDRYFKIPKNGCQYGYGVRSSCLDPFYTLAADLTIYKPGEVIYIPAVVGLDLPDGSKHTGYFVIRDRGRGIVGRGRFDFFSGYYSWRDPANPFNKLGLADQKTNIPYYRIKGERAKAVLAVRAFPGLPQDIQVASAN